MAKRRWVKSQRFALNWKSAKKYKPDKNVIRSLVVTYKDEEGELGVRNDVYYIDGQWKVEALVDLEENGRSRWRFVPFPINGAEIVSWAYDFEVEPVVFEED